MVPVLQVALGGGWYAETPGSKNGRERQNERGRQAQAQERAKKQHHTDFMLPTNVY